MKPEPTFSLRSLASILFVALCIAAACSEPLEKKPPPQGQLSNLSITPTGDLVPPFESETTSYAASVPSDSPSVAVMATTEDAAATITVNGVTIPPGAIQSVPLRTDEAPTPIEVVVQPVDGEAITYVVTVTKRGQCSPATPDDCCPQDYQERVCGAGGCGKESRTCAATGKWDEWSGCGVDGAKIGKVCRNKAQVCDPVEVCGGAVDCPADYVEVPLNGRPGCWQNVYTTFHPGNCHAHGCYPDHGPTAQRRCEEAGYKVYTSQSSPKVAGDSILVGLWTGARWEQRGIGGGRAMTSVTCLK